MFALGIFDFRGLNLLPIIIADESNVAFLQNLFERFASRFAALATIIDDMPGNGNTVRPVC